MRDTMWDVPTQEIDSMKTTLEVQSQMADVTTANNKSEENYVDITKKECDFKCEGCIKYKTELTKAISELKSAI